ncbi:MAG: hypothetical protein IKC61_02600 [Clostridia bacterium]|nr:hypothetical protein [Clostridia bacterium]
MKNIRFIVLLVLMLSVLLFSFASCDAVEDVAGKVPGLENLLDKLPGGDDHVHAFSDATCTAPKTCECGATEGEALGHTYEAVVTAPTCTNAGYTTYLCKCGEDYRADVVEALGHTFTEGKCACGAEDPNYNPHVHSYEAVVTAPTCTEAGFTTYTCACGDTYTADETKALGHSHEAVVTAPTCTEAGYTTYTCACGDTYTADETKALGHTFIDSKCHCGAEYVDTTTEWFLTTELKNGDLVLIGAPAYGKLLSAEKVNATSYYNKGVNYTADDFSNVTDAEIFVVTVNEDGTYTFTSLTGDVIALAASYSSLNKDGEHKSWALTDRGDGTFLMKNTGRNLYLEWYSSKDNWSTYSAGNTNEYYLSFYVKNDNFAAGGEHVHNHISNAVAPTCTEAGYTTYTCACGDTYTVDGEAATGHSHEATVTAPTCTEAGYTTYTCKCGDTYTVEGDAATGHTYVDGVCACGETDPTVHFHVYEAVVTAPTCTATGYTTYTCSCGDSYTGDETAKIPHIDENLDVECDREGCTFKVAPPADSTLSNYTANCLGSKLSTSNAYYVEGTIVEVLDQKNGIFLLDDGTGETFYFRLPKNAEDVSHANWEIKLTLGDKVRLYGKINKFSSTTAPNGQYWPAMQGPVVTLLEQHAHDFTFSPATCSDPAFCVCGQSYGESLDCVDTDGNDLCDACGRNVKYVYEYVEIRTDNDSGVLDTTAGTYTWSNDNFDVQVAKGTSSQLYSTAKDHMRVYKGNEFILVSKNGLTVKTITVYLTNATQVGNFEKFLTGYTYTKNEENFSITVEINSAETLTFANTASTTQIKGVEFGYEPPAHEHSYTSTVTAPTCTEAGFTTYTCACGDTYTEPGEAATGHTYADATCTAPKTCHCGATEGEALGHTGYTEDYVCDTCNTVIEPEADSTLTIAQAITLANAMGNNYTTNKYYITGRIVDISNTFNGNFNIVDASGNKLYIYGLKNAVGEGNFSNLNPQPAVGDEITLYTVVGCYENAPQAKGAWLDELVQHTEHEWVDATCTDAKYCSICGKVEGEPADHTYVDGVCTGCGKTEVKGEVVTYTEDFAGLTKGSSYGSHTTTSGWTAVNAAVLVGGSSDANPVFKFIGASDATKAITLNGHTDKVGKLTSATLSGGISKLSFNYGHAFSDKNGVDITINIIQNGEVVATYNLDNDSVTQKTAYSFVWELDTVVEGDFVIEIVNNSPSATAGNKDRVSIFNLSWDSAPVVA